MVYWSTDLADKGSVAPIETSVKLGCISGDCQNGHGIYVENDKKNTVKFIGNFKKGEINGNGKIYLSNQLTYDREWSNGKYNGKGTLYSGEYNESKYVGVFKNGLKT